MDAKYNIHLDRADFLNSELVSLVDELSKRNLRFEEAALFQIEIYKIYREMVTLKASDS